MTNPPESGNEKKCPKCGGTIDFLIETVKALSDYVFSVGKDGVTQREYDTTTDENVSDYFTCPTCCQVVALTEEEAKVILR